MYTYFFKINYVATAVDTLLTKLPFLCESEVIKIVNLQLSTIDQFVANYNQVKIYHRQSICILKDTIKRYRKSIDIDIIYS